MTAPSESPQAAFSAAGLARIEAWMQGYVDSGKSAAMADTYCRVDPQQQLIGILMQQYLPSLHHRGRKEYRDLV